MKTINHSKVGMLAILLFALFQVNFTVAQSDSITVELEKRSDTDTYYKHKYQYLDISLGDQKRLFKFALQPFKPGNFYNFTVLNVQLAYEKKVSTSISFVNEINASFNWLDSGKVYTTNFAIGARWYPEMKQRIEDGKSGNNCNGYYIGLKASILKAIAFRDKKQGYPYDRVIDIFDPTPEFSIGLQQRFSNLFYVDANAFVNYSFQSGAGYGIMVLLGISLNVED